MSDRISPPFRGSSWYFTPAGARRAGRFEIPHCLRSHALGLRLVEEVEEVEEVVGHVFRGGRWTNSPTYARGAYSLWAIPAYRYDYLGFRLVEAQGGCDE